MERGERIERARLQTKMVEFIRLAVGRSQVNLKFGLFASYTVVVQERQIYFTKRGDTLAELLFCSLNLLFCFVFTLP